MQNQTSSRRFALGGLTVVVSADLPILDGTYQPKIRKFETAQPGEDEVHLHHSFCLPEFVLSRDVTRLYQKPPWEIYRRDEGYVYVHYVPDTSERPPVLIASFTGDHSRGEIYHFSPQIFQYGGSHSLTFFPTDQILFARVLAEHQGAIFHSAGLVINDKGLLFAGHSGAGKSTLTSLLRSAGKILCDDRNIVRWHPDGWQLYGTWSHGDIPVVSPETAPLRAILLLEQAGENRLIPVENRAEVIRRLPFLIVKPLVTADWWEKTLDLVQRIAAEIPVYRLRFEKSERVIDALKPLIN